jgi:hypothetical protein
MVVLQRIRPIVDIESLGNFAWNKAREKEDVS